MEKIFDMDVTKFNESEHPLFIAYSYITKTKSNIELFRNNPYAKTTLLYFLMREYINSYATGASEPSKYLENVSFYLKSNPDINQVITVLSREHNNERIAVYKSLLKNELVKTLDLVKASDKYFNDLKIKEFLDSDPDQLLCGGNKFPDAFKDTLINHYSDDNFYLTLKSFYNPETNIPCEIASGSLAYICARPAAGKTTALISIALEVLEQNKELEKENKAKRKVVFITTEETPFNLYIKLVKAYCYTHYYQPKWNEIIGNTQKFFENQLFNIFSNKITPATNENDALLYEIQQGIKESEKAVGNYFYNNELIFSDTEKYTSFNDLLDVMHEANGHGVILLDYIQHLPKMPNDKNSLILANRTDQLRETSRQILEQVKKDNSICFAGAQMKRESTKEDRVILKKEEIRECSDFEQDASLILGFGKNGAQGFYNVMKYRDAAYNDDKLALITGHYGYSCIKSSLNEKGVELFTQDKEKGSKTAGPGTPAGSTKANKYTSNKEY